MGKRPSYKQMYLALLESVSNAHGSSTGDEIQVMRPGEVATHELEVELTTTYTYKVQYGGSASQLEAEEFDGDDTERVKVVSVERRLGVNHLPARDLRPYDARTTEAERRERFPADFDGYPDPYW